MKRNLKALGLALAATFAMSAVVVGGVSAGVATDKFHSDGELTHLTAEALSKQVFTAGEGAENEIVCNKVNVHDATIEGEAADKITVVPTYTECSVRGTGPETTFKASATVDPNDCGYEFTGTTDANGHAEVTIECDSPTSPGITVRVSGFQVPCIHVEPQEVNGVSYDNDVVEGVEDVTLISTVEGIKSVTTHNGFICPTATGGDVTDTTGTYTGEVTVTGFEDEAHEVPTDIWVE